MGAGAYSYVFDGQSGYLDHALASNALAPRVTGVTEWHINADEPIALDYNVEFKTHNQVNTFYAANPFRSSDHDPVVVGINLIEPFSWSGFFSPVGEWNSVKAGRAVPLKFSLGGNRGLDIFSAGSPSSAQASCEGTVSGPSEPTVTPGGSSLTYDASSDSYTYVWRTQQEWSGTCRTAGRRPRRRHQSLGHVCVPRNSGDSGRERAAGCDRMRGADRRIPIQRLTSHDSPSPDMRRRLPRAWICRCRRRPGDDSGRTLRAHPLWLCHCAAHRVRSASASAIRSGQPLWRDRPQRPRHDRCPTTAARSRSCSSTTGLRHSRCNAVCASHNWWSHPSRPSRRA